MVEEVPKFVEAEEVVEVLDAVETALAEDSTEADDSSCVVPDVRGTTDTENGGDGWTLVGKKVRTTASGGGGDVKVRFQANPAVGRVSESQSYLKSLVVRHLVQRINAKLDHR